MWYICRDGEAKKQEEGTTGRPKLTLNSLPNIRGDKS